VRSRLLFFLLTGMLLALLYLVGTRNRDPHEVPRPRPKEVPAAPSGSGLADASPSAAPVVPGDGGSAGDARAPALDRPLRIVAASWEAAASLLVANGGPTTTDGSAVRAGGLEVRVDVVADEHDIEQRLARGGADADGADVAVVSIPTAIVANERLSALELQAFFVVGWSRGREVLLGTDDGLLAKPRASAKETPVVSQDEAASVLAVFALGQNTTPPNVRVVRAADGGPLVAFARPLPTDRTPTAPTKVLLTTADASHLVPIVAVAPRGFFETRADAAVALVRAWLAGEGSLKKDIPAVARTIAAEQGAPDPATVIERLGWIATSDAADNARTLLVAQQGAMDAQALFRLEASLHEGAGVLSAHQADRANVATGPLRRALGADAAKASAPPFTPPAADARVWLAHRIDKGDASDVARQIATLAGVFDRSAIRVSTKPASLAKDAATSAQDDFGVASERVVVGAAPPADGSRAWLEVLAAP
jgi:hypothetical protein